MNRLIFATNNSHKLQEVSSMLSGLFDITGLSQTDFSGDIPETAETLQGNALTLFGWQRKDSRLDLLSPADPEEIRAHRYAGRVDRKSHV